MGGGVDLEDVLQDVSLHEEVQLSETGSAQCGAGVDLENVLQDESLHAGVVDADGAAADLLAVQHQVVVLGSDLLTSTQTEIHLVYSRGINTCTNEINKYIHTHTDITRARTHTHTYTHTHTHTH